MPVNYANILSQSNRHWQLHDRETPLGRMHEERIVGNRGTCRANESKSGMTISWTRPKQIHHLQPLRHVRLIQPVDKQVLGEEEGGEN